MNKSRSMTSIISIAFKFDGFEFGWDIAAKAKEFNLNFSEVDILCGVGHGLSARYVNLEENNMKMQSFLKLCNGLDLDPRKYFELRV